MLSAEIPTTGIGSDIGGYVINLFGLNLPFFHSCNAFQVPSVYLLGSTAYMAFAPHVVVFHTPAALILLKAKIPYNLFLDRCQTAWVELKFS